MVLGENAASARMVVHVAKADVSQLPVDAVVTPSSTPGIMVGTAARGLRVRGGADIEAEARAAAPIAVGAAIVTGPGRLFCRHVIHVPVVEQPGEKIGVENARRATRAALVAASAYNLDVIGIPGIGTGIGGLSYEEAARAIVDEVRGYRSPKPQTIYLVDQDEMMLRAFEDALRQTQ
jgi:O-acetyl-ADP-ribose deacetylase (regulator of RNase III)